MDYKTKRELFENGELDDAYAEYIMNNCGDDRVICNGDTLICAMEAGYLSEDFLQNYNQ